MQKVIFVCLLALSMCLCSPIEEKGNPKATAQNTVPKNAEIAEIQHDATPKPTPAEHAATQNATETAQKQTNATATVETALKANESQTTAITPKEATTKADNKTTATATTANATTETKANANTEKAASATTPAKTNANTEKAESAPPKVPEPTPKATTTAKPAADDAHAAVQTRKFDGPSFVGGIIMTVGLLAISFMGYKYYKNQTERNYHTL